MAGRGRRLKRNDEQQLVENLRKVDMIGNKNTANGVAKNVTLETPVMPIQNKKQNAAPTPEQKLEKKKKVVPNANKYIAKYSYKANPNSPAGFKELSLKQGQEIVFIEKHREQTHWCKIKINDEEGYVPFSYLYCNEVTSLPWLKSKTEEEVVEPPKKFEFKPYKSAYTKKETVNSSVLEQNPDPFLCEICNKKLNGPVPYRAHMNSRAHKEEVEAAKEYGRI